MTAVRCWAGPLDGDLVPEQGAVILALPDAPPPTDVRGATAYYDGPMPRPLTYKLRRIATPGLEPQEWLFYVLVGAEAELVALVRLVLWLCRRGWAVPA